jgi:glyoxylase-like metal-dependent hydrolase (beta-lactamase superfamily II)
MTSTTTPHPTPDAVASAPPAVDAATLRAWLAAGRPVTVLDVRTNADRAEWAIPGSLHVDAYDALKAGDDHALDRFDLPADRPVVAVCGAGVVSLRAAALLRARGLDARSLTGGMRAWSLAWNTADVPLPGSAATVIQVRRTGKGCLSYLIGAGTVGEAAVIDPSLAPEVYIDLAATRGWRITRVLETHVHADHLSRARALAEQTGAALLLPAAAADRVVFPFMPVADGAAVALGPATLVVLATPGHTPESTSYLLDGVALFTGDTLFLTSVGRPDLHADTAAVRAKALALFGSLRRLLALPPATLVLPGHDSAPAAFDGVPTTAMLGDVRARTALLALPEDAFVAQILSRLPATPPNHEPIIARNEAGAPIIDDPAELEAGANRCAVV